jgi:hydrogenase maturation protein HypF
MHPDYLATKYALEAGAKQGLKLISVQHHHAHIASCLIEHNIEGPVIGIVFDGTGYGSDGSIWGGEFLIADWHSFERWGHLEYVPMPGGTAAIEKPYRMALGYVYTLLGEDFPTGNLPLLSKVDPLEEEIIKRQLRQGINSPWTSSVGRLFDGIAALAGMRGEAEYEAQAAIELEMLAPNEAASSDCYPFAIEEHQGTRIVKLGELILNVVQDIQDYVPVSIISIKFHHTLARMIAEGCKSIAKERGLSQVALSGGVFQNRLLLRLATSALQGEGFDVLTHRLVPCNDGGISLGQAVIANFS